MGAWQRIVDRAGRDVVTGRDQHRSGVQPTVILISLFVALAIGGLLWTLSGKQRHGYPDATVACFPGFTANESTAIPNGLVVTSLRRGSEAQRDGIEVGDIIIEVDNAKVQSFSHVAALICQSGRVQTEMRLLHKGTPRAVRLGRS